MAVPTAFRKSLAAAAWLCFVAVASASSVRGQNLLSNPDFNDSFAGWTATGGTAMGTSTSDADACPESLSLQLGSVLFMGFHVTEAEADACVPVDNDTLYLRMSYLSTGQVNGVRRHCYDNSSCNGGFMGTADVLLGGPAADFIEISGSAVMPQGCYGVKFRVFSFHSAQAHPLLADRLFVGRVPRLFSDDFEGGNFCRWP
jgi:hypothetical protein